MSSDPYQMCYPSDLIRAIHNNAILLVIHFICQIDPTLFDERSLVSVSLKIIPFFNIIVLISYSCTNIFLQHLVGVYNHIKFWFMISSIREGFKICGCCSRQYVDFVAHDM